MSTNLNYHSYLLRVWRDNANQPWRASLQSTVTEDKHAFADLHALLLFLKDELTVASESSEVSPEALLDISRLGAYQ